MKKIVIELLRQENSWVHWGWHPTEWKLNIDDYVLEWANKNNAYVYKHYLHSGEYPYDPAQYIEHEKFGKVQLCVHTKELVIYYYPIREVPDEVSEMNRLKEQLDEWENKESLLSV